MFSSNRILTSFKKIFLIWLDVYFSFCERKWIIIPLSNISKEDVFFLTDCLLAQNHALGIKYSMIFQVLFGPFLNSVSFILSNYLAAVQNKFARSACEKNQFVSSGNFFAEENWFILQIIHQIFTYSKSTTQALEKV